PCCGPATSDALHRPYLSLVNPDGNASRAPTSSSDPLVPSFTLSVAILPFSCLDHIVDDTKLIAHITVLDRFPLVVGRGQRLTSLRLRYVLLGVQLRPPLRTVFQQLLRLRRT